MYNKVVMVGNLTRDIELRYLPSGAAIAKSAIATSYKYKTSTGEQKDEVCFLDFNMFGRSAEVANQYLKKGSKVLLEGRLVLEQWTAQDGSNRSKHSLRVDTMKMLDGQQQQGAQQNDSQSYGNQNTATQQSAANYHQQANQYHQGNTTKSSQEHNLGNGANHDIPEIDIEEDEIPF